MYWNVYVDGLTVIGVPFAVQGEDHRYTRPKIAQLSFVNK